jgi:hypothetical protein
MIVGEREKEKKRERERKKERENYLFNVMIIKDHSHC